MLFLQYARYMVITTHYTRASRQGSRWQVSFGDASGCNTALQTNSCNTFWSIYILHVGQAPNPNPTTLLW